MTAKAASPIRRRFDYPPFPAGWFQIAWSDELRRGGVRPVDAFGRRLVLFRGQDGRPRVLDAYCPHLGADLGVGGTVEGDDIRCPFHGWQFDGAGVCTKIPFSRKIPPKARVGTWPVREINGVVLVWHDADGRAPWFEIPPLPEYGSPAWSKVTPVSTTIRTGWREVLENSVDRAHFQALHQYPEPPKMEFSTDGPRFRMRSEVRWKRFGIHRDVRLDIDGVGPSYAITRGVGEASFVVIGTILPIDEDTVVHRMSFMVSREIPFLLREPARRLMIYLARREFERDVPIWENKIGHRRPVLCDVDGPIGRFRAWTEQFFPAAAAEDAARAS
jgi:nitrite reductase/ring-hydroxylating ferredoxin subunit